MAMLVDRLIRSEVDNKHTIITLICRYDYVFNKPCSNIITFLIIAGFAFIIYPK